MGTTATKYVAELRNNEPVKAGRIIALSSLVSWVVSLVLMVALYLGAPWLCLHTLAAPHLTGYVRISGLLLVLSGVNGAQLGVLSGFEAFKSIARVSALRGHETSRSSWKVRSFSAWAGSSGDGAGTGNRVPAESVCLAP